MQGTGHQDTGRVDILTRTDPGTQRLDAVDHRILQCRSRFGSIFEHLAIGASQLRGGQGLFGGNPAEQPDSIRHATGGRWTEPADRGFPRTERGQQSAGIELIERAVHRATPSKHIGAHWMCARANDPAVLRDSFSCSAVIRMSARSTSVRMAMA
ncbi:hypothetical protein [Nocardia sp. NPDC004123]